MKARHRKKLAKKLIRIWTFANIEEAERRLVLALEEARPGELVPLTKILPFELVYVLAGLRVHPERWSTAL